MKAIWSKLNFLSATVIMIGGHATVAQAQPRFSTADSSTVTISAKFIGPFQPFF